MVKCEVCSDIFPNLQILSRHLKTEHQISYQDYIDRYHYKGNPPRCERCGEKREFKSGKYWGGCLNCSLHQCHLCGSKFRSRLVLSRHVSKEHLVEFQSYVDQYDYANQPPVCPDCGKTYKFYKGKYADTCTCSFRRGEERCLVCDGFVRGRNGLMTHLHTRHNLKRKEYVDQYVYGGEPPVCEKCGSELLFRGGDYQEICTQCGFGEICAICGTNCQNLKGLVSHLRFQHQVTDIKSYIDNHKYKGSPPRCRKCGELLYYFKGRYYDWCHRCRTGTCLKFFYRGWFVSEKNDRSFYFRSSYEKKAFIMLENDKKVASFETEKSIQMENGKWCRPDLLVTYTDNTRRIIEIKPRKYILDPDIQYKIQQVSLWASHNNVDEVIFWSEKNLGLPERRRDGKCW
jgi:hypothetical protein